MTSRDLCFGVKRIVLHTRVYGSRHSLFIHGRDFIPIAFERTKRGRYRGLKKIVVPRDIPERSPLMLLHGGLASSLNDVMIIKWAPRRHRVGRYTVGEKLTILILLITAPSRGMQFPFLDTARFLQVTLHLLSRLLYNQSFLIILQVCSVILMTSLSFTFFKLSITLTFYCFVQKKIYLFV